MARINNPTLHRKCCIASEIPPPLPSHTLLFKPPPNTLEMSRGGGGDRTSHMSLWICTYRQNTKYPRVTGVCDFTPSFLFQSDNCLSFCGGICVVKKAAIRKRKQESCQADRLGHGDRSKQCGIRLLSASIALWHIQAFQSFLVSFWLPHAAPAVYHRASQGDDSGFSVTFTPFPLPSSFTFTLCRSSAYFPTLQKFSGD